jgi:hypothetical protein
MTLETAKQVPLSKVSEWKGLDRISLVVHGMHCIWREQEKDDIGIDGEIELCVSRTDGEGRVGTGKIIKVQSKSGTSYVTSNTSSSFHMPTRREDLDYWNKANFPVVVIVYHHKDDKLYWVHVQAQIEARDDMFVPPYIIRFDKSTDLFDESAYARLLEIVNTAPPRVALDVKETLFTNALEILEMPKSVVRSTVLPEKRAQFRQRLTGFVPPHIYQVGHTITFTEPMATENALKDVVDGQGEVIELDAWLDQTEANENNLRFLLKRLLHRHLTRNVGLVFDHDVKRYYFPVDDPKTSSKKMKWKNARTNRNAERSVVTKYDYGKVSFFRHLGIEPEFLRIGDSWALILEPKHHYTTDGKIRWETKKAHSYAIRWRSREYNAQYLNHILFWAYIISKGNQSFTLDLDGTSLLRISGLPMSAEVGFGVRGTSEGR